MQPDSNPSEGLLIPVLAAPTASGKSGVALELADTLNLEILTADAMQVYKEMDIGTAKPTALEQARVPHHLIDLVQPDDAFSVADYVRQAEACIRQVLERGRLPLVVGGTGFYIRALVQGLPTVPAADKKVQAELWDVFEQKGLDPLLKELEVLSPSDAARAQRNPRRVVRALEVWRRSGTSPADFPYTRPAFRYDQMLLLPEMSVLEPRIQARTKDMFKRGLVAEVKALLARYPERPTATQAIGYKEVIAHLEGHASLEEAKAAVTLATRQYAKRQHTWFRKTREAEHLPSLAAEVQDRLEQWLSRLKMKAYLRS